MESRVIVSQDEAMARLYKIGAGAASVGAIHILTLLLSWFVESDGGILIQLTGYVFPESLALSLLGGLLAGIGLLSGYLIKRIGLTKLFVGVFAAVGGVLALSSPLYVYLVKILSLNIKGYPDIGMFAAVFTGVVQLGVGALALLTPTKREVIPTARPTAPLTQPELFEPAPSTTPARRTSPTAQRLGATTRFIPASDIEEATCSICYEPVQRPEAVKCENCGTIYHRGCMEAWVGLNSTCPNCKAIVLE